MIYSNKYNVVDESAASFVTLGIMALAGVAYAACKWNKDKQESLGGTKEVRKAIRDYASKFSDVSKFNNKMKGIEKISHKDFIDKVKLSEKEQEIFYRGEYAIYTIIDPKDSIMAYCILNRINPEGYVYKILDKSCGNSKQLQIFIQATFENRLKGIGPGLKEIMKNHKPNGYFDNHYSNAEYDAVRISKEEFSANYDKVNAVIQIMASHFEQIAKKYPKVFRDGVEYRIPKKEELISKLNLGEKVKLSSHVYMDYDYNDDDCGDIIFDIQTELFNRLIKDVKRLGFKVNEEYIGDEVIETTGSPDKYSGVEVSYDNNNGDNDIVIFVNYERSFQNESTIFESVRFI